MKKGDTQVVTETQAGEGLPDTEVKAETGLTDTEPMTEEKQAVVAETQKATRREELERAIEERAKIAGVLAGDSGNVDLARQLIESDTTVKSLEASVALNGYRIDITSGIKDLLEKITEVNITRLFYQKVISYPDGKEMITYETLLNDEVKTGKAKSSSKTGEGEKKGRYMSQWKNGKTGEVRPAIDVYQEFGEHKLDGTVKAGAWLRVINGLHNLGLCLDWQQV